MGKAVRWLKGLLGGKKSGGGAVEKESGKEKKRWGFGKSMRERETRAPVVEERRGSYREVVTATAEEESKRAIAVAAATAAVAEAAVAAAQAAAAVVRLTSSGRGVGAVGFGGLKREDWAAIKIQATFRGYLARRALKALKGLVKLQALVRGNIVRKQAAETLRCMQALVRVQARARACRALRAEKTQSKSGGSARSHPGPPTPDKTESTIRHDRAGNLKRNSSKPVSSDSTGHDKTHASGWNWLDRWMEERYWESREAIAKLDDDKSTKILEIDTGKQQQQLNNKRRGSGNQLHSSCSTLTSDQNSRSFTTMPASPSKDSTVAQQSVASPASVDMQPSLSPLRFHAAMDAGEFGDSPQFYSASSRPGSSRRGGAFTPAKSECTRSLFSGYSDYPNYMANTESSKAKLRSHSAPKQRPEYDKSGSIKRLSVHQAFGQQQQQLPNSISSQQRSSSLHAKFTNKAYPGSGRLDRLGMPLRT